MRLSSSLRICRSEQGIGYVIVQHLSPAFPSMMVEILARHTLIPINRAEDGMPVEPDTIYLIPPKKNMIIASGRLHLTEQDPTESLHLPIDIFLRSLAQDLRNRAIAVISIGNRSRRIPRDSRNSQCRRLRDRPRRNHGKIRWHAQGRDCHRYRKLRVGSGLDPNRNPESYRSTSRPPCS